MVENALWLFICPRERAIQISQELREQQKTQKAEVKKLWQM